jgi:hypothetical protein
MSGRKVHRGNPARKARKARRDCAGISHTCALETDGEIACWGDDYDGQATVPAGLDLGVQGPQVATVRG